MKKILYFLLVSVILIFFVFILPKNHRSFSVNEIKNVEVANQKIKVDVVNTPETRAQGLSGRESLAENEGMLFVFDNPSDYSFWMKDMNFSIDMIWIGEDMKITYIKKNATPESYPEGFGPKEKTSKYVLEVFSGFSDKYDLETGDKVLFLP
ncbi:MAG: DUF192 domain-containing protein [Candidatus Pacebacteria bacterium]|nr:DUF192 domain-containing protein [Candidatus Paceibacterota bacterium]